MGRGLLFLILIVVVVVLRLLYIRKLMFLLFLRATHTFITSCCFLALWLVQR